MGRCPFPHVTTPTVPAAAALYRHRLMALPGEQRMIMAMAMFDTARAFVLASFADDLSEHEKRVALCRRFYGDGHAERYAEGLPQSGG